MYNEVTFVSNSYGTEKTSLIYDTINCRVIEKWKSYQLKRDETEYVINDREIFVYDAFGHIHRVIDIETGNTSTHNYGSIPNYKEYASIKKREYNFHKKDYYRDFRTDIKYFNYFNSKSRCFKTLTLKVLFDDEIDSCTLRLETIKTGSILYKYIYSASDPTELFLIKEYDILINFTFINKFIDFLVGGIPLLDNIPKLFLKYKRREKRDDFLNGLEKFNADNQNYFVPNYSTEKVLIHKELLKEDIFYGEKDRLLEMYKNHE